MKKMGSLSGSILLALVILLVPGRVHGQSAADLMSKLERLNAYPDLIVVNGKIATMDEQLTEVEAMAVRNNRILALGRNNDIRFLAGPNTEVLDAKGRTVLPGLIEGHTHPHVWAVGHWLGAEGEFISKKYNDPQLKIVAAKGKDQAEVLRSLERVVRQRAQELGPGKWIWVFVFAGKDSLPKSREIVDPLFRGTITREYLDTLAPNNPLMVMTGQAVGPAANNTKAKEEMIKFLGREEVGLRARTPVTYDILFRGRTEEKMDFLKRELLQCVAAKGVTTFANHYYGTPSIMKIYNLLYQRGELPVRWAWYVGTLWNNDDNDLSFFYRNLGDFRGIGNDYIWNAGVSNEGWEGGIPGLRCTKAQPLDSNKPISGPGPCSDSRDYENTGGYRNVRAGLEAGLRMAYMHNYTDGTYDIVFRMLEGLIAEGKLTLEEVQAARIQFEHNAVIRPEQGPTLAKYGIIPNFSGFRVQQSSYGGPFLQTYGEKYMGWLEPMKAMADAGVRVVMSTDAHLTKVPIEFKDMNYANEWDGSIWPYVEFFLTRRMPNEGVTYDQNERMDRVDLMKAVTINPAYQVLREKDIGSLEVGKLADFIVIDKDYFTIPEDQIHTIQNLLTAVGGKTVFKAPNY